MLNPLYTYILNIYDLIWFYGKSTLVSYLIPNPLYTCIKSIGLMDGTLTGILIPGQNRSRSN